MVGISTEEARSALQRFLVNNVAGLPVFSPGMRTTLLRRLRIAIGDSRIAAGVRFYGNSLSIGDGVTVGKNVRFYSEATITVMDGAVIEDGAVLDTRIRPDSRSGRERWSAPITIPANGLVAAGRVIFGDRAGTASAVD